MIGRTAPPLELPAARDRHPAAATGHAEAADRSWRRAARRGGAEPAPPPRASAGADLVRHGAGVLGGGVPQLLGVLGCALPGRVGRGLRGVARDLLAVLERLLAELHGVRLDAVGDRAEPLI